MNAWLRGTKGGTRVGIRRGVLFRIVLFRIVFRNHSMRVGPSQSIRVIPSESVYPSHSVRVSLSGGCSGAVARRTAQASGSEGPRLSGLRLGDLRANIREWPTRIHESSRQCTRVADSDRLGRGSGMRAADAA